MAEGGPMKARALRKSQELDKARALSHLLYRSAKQDASSLCMPSGERCRKAVCGRTACTV